MRPALVSLLTAGALVAVPIGAHASAGGDGRACGTLDDTRSVKLVAYSVSCSKASQVVKTAVGSKITSSRSRTVSGTHLGFSCRGSASKRRISVSCRRGGGAQFLTARGSV